MPQLRRTLMDADLQFVVRLLYRLLRQFALGDVHRHPNGTHRPPRPSFVIKERLRSSDQPADPSVAANDPVLGGIDAVPRGIVSPLDRRRDTFTVIGMIEVKDGGNVDRLIGAYAIDLPHLGRPLNNIRAMVVLENPQTGRTNSLAHPFFADAQCLFVPLLIGDVTYDRYRPDDIAPGVSYRG